jgi:hypothetical protein
MSRDGHKPLPATAIAVDAEEPANETGGSSY